MNPADLLCDRTGRFRAVAHYLERLFGKNWFCCFCILLTGSFVRTPALQGPFLWDDTYLAGTNPFIKSPLLILESFRHYLFLDSYSTHYRPVQNISFMPDYWLWGDNPFGFHLSNIIWHVAAGVMLFLLLRRLLRNLAQPTLSEGGSHFLAFFLALTWVVHPVHSAAIDYVSGRADSLACFFACTAWLGFLRARTFSNLALRVSAYNGCFLLGLLALCSRETAVIWLLLFLLYHLVGDREASHQTKWLVLTACLALMAAYAGLRHLPPPRVHGGGAPDWPASMRTVLMLRALGDYGRLMVFPSHLHMERTVFDPIPLRDPTKWRSNSGVEYLSLLGLALLVVFAAGMRWRKPGRRLRVAGAAWFFIAYLPTSNIVGLNATVAEHWLYLPSIGFLLFLAGCVIALPRRTHAWSIGLTLLFILGLGTRSYYRSEDWSSAETFFRRTLAGSGSSRAATNLALVYSRRGDYARAEKLLRRVLQLSPDDPIARNNLADALRHLGRNAEAEKLLVATTERTKQIEKDYPRTWVVAANLARLRHYEKNDKEAFAILAQARKDNPDVWELVSYEAELLREDRGPKAAQQIVEQFARRNPWHYGAALALGRVYAEKGDAPAATEALLRASRLDVRDVEALNLLAQIRIRQHRLNDAYLAQRRALGRQPDAPSQYTLLSDILEKMGRSREAKGVLAQAKRLQESARKNVALLN